jgi:drug/metabolite transporter (DMT)-like permease
MLLAMAMTGTGALAAKSFVEIRVQSTALDYSAFTFIGAAASAVVTWPLVSRVVRRHRLKSTAATYPKARPWRSWLAIGVALGIANFLQNSSLVQALSELPGTLVFPVIVSSYLLLISLADYAIWKRRFGKIALAGVFLAISGLVLANL